MRPIGHRFVIDRAESIVARYAPSGRADEFDLQAL
jgi:hypothetical protein